MKNIIFIIYIISSINLQSQNKGFDNPWLIGNEMLLDFSGDSVQISHQQRNMGLSVGSASISDSLGNMLFYTNGFSICNKNHDTMGGGHLLVQNEFVNAYKANGLPLAYALAIIPNPKKAGQYYLFHELVDEDINMHYYYRTYKLLYSLIDVNANFGNGYVIQKSVPVYQDTFAISSMAAVKHANGKDWWLTVSNWRGNEVFMFLVNENGISPPIIQNLGIPTPFYIPLNQTYDDDSGVTFFSQDGTKLVRGAYNQGFQIYDFDRCTGILGNPITISCPNEIWGAALSPSGRFLYQSALDKVYQYDMWATDIGASKTLIANYDGYATPPGSGFQTNFYLATLAPNGKIYINSINSVMCLHVINEPDSLGVACNLVQHGLMLPYYNDATIPTPPNYYLGAATTPCYGVDKEEGIRQAVKVYPNPAQDKIYIEMPMAMQAATFLLYDISGKEVLSQNIIGSKESIFVGKLAKGMYFYEVIFNTKKEYGKIFIE